MIACALFEPFTLWQAVREKPELNTRVLITLNKGKVEHLSEPARALGIAPGMSEQGAYARCNDLVVIEADDFVLKNAWDEILGQLYGLTDRIEGVRLGLAFVEVSKADAEFIAKHFQVAIGIGASQEEAHLKALAGENIAAAGVDILEALGLKAKTITRLRWQGVETVGQLRQWSRAHLAQYLGKEAVLITPYLKGPYRTDVSRYMLPTKLIESYSFEDAVTEPWQWMPVLHHLCDALAAQLGDKAASRLTLTATATGLTFSATRVAKEALRGSRIATLAAKTLEDSGVLGLELERLTLELCGLYRPSSQGSLWQQRENMQKAVDKVEARFPGAMLKVECINPYMPVSKFAYRLSAPGGERVKDGQARRGRRSRGSAHQGRRAADHAHPRQLPRVA